MQVILWDVTKFTAFKIMKNILLSYLFKSLDHRFGHFYNIVMLSVIIQYTIIAKTHKNRVFEMYAIIVII